MNDEHLGSNFDGFLEEEGLLVDVETLAVKRGIAYQVEQLMKEQGLTKTEMARRMKSSRTTLERLLDPSNRSIKIRTLACAAHAMGKRLQIKLN